MSQFQEAMSLHNPNAKKVWCTPQVNIARLQEAQTLDGLGISGFIPKS